MSAVPKFSLPPSEAETLALLRTSPIIAQAVTERAAQTLEERRRTAALRAEIDAEELKAAKAKYAFEEKAAAEIKAAENALADLRNRRTAELHQLAQEVYLLGRRHDEVTRSLIHTANPAIAEFVSELDDLAFQLRDLKPDLRTIVDTNPVTGKRVETVHSNRPSITARLAAIKRAKEEALELRFVADQTDIPAKLEALRQALPAIKEASA